MRPTDPEWLEWARELQTLAQTGLTFTRDPYDRERYEQLRHLSARMFHAHTAEPVARITTLFAGETGYATPKVDARAAVFDAQGRLLMVREAADNDLWTLPGGWVDVNLTPRENAVKEVREESGYNVAVTKRAAVWDRTRQGHPSGVFSCTKMIFLCRLVGGSPVTSLETSEVGWFDADSVPADLSLARVLPEQVARIFDHREQRELPTDYD